MGFQTSPSDSFTGSFADTNRGRGNVSGWWQGCEMLGPEVAGGFIFTMWKPLLGEKSIFNKSRVERCTDKR